MSIKDVPIFAHVDVARCLITARRAGYKIAPENIQASILEFMSSALAGRSQNLHLPAFNYDYGKTRVFDVRRDPVQVGALPEWVRRQGYFHRSEIPFFSFISGSDLGLVNERKINPFGSGSGFHALYTQQANVAFAGADLPCFTFIHYIEEQAGAPVYRYQKSFPGEIIGADGQNRACELTMHVRPLGVHMDYDWPRLERDLTEYGILERHIHCPEVKVISCVKALEFVGNRISKDPFYLVDQATRIQLLDVTDNGRRRISIEDYENA